MQSPSLEVSAQHLGLSTRTLRRNLENEGTSYQALMNNFRLDLAREYLKSEHLTPKEIGYLVGFKNISAFRRAFKAWTGKTVQQFRDENFA
jgi:AraC-like DNA-binding protein